MALKILVIDDSPSTAQMAENALQQHFPGCDILTASCGSDGYERVNFTSPDLILLNDTLPDMDASVLLDRLCADSHTAQTPVVLLVDPAKAHGPNGSHANVARSLAKPVSAESLVEAVGTVLGQKPGGRKMLGSRGGVVFSGNTGFVSLRQALQMAQGDRLTGVLRFPLGRHAIELWMSGGRFLFATTKNATLYCAGSAVILSATSLGHIIEGQQNQQLTGCPLFLFVGVRNDFPHDDVVQITRDHGLRLFSQLFTAGRVNFEFEETDQFPDFARNFPPTNEDADNWVLGALRQVRFDQLSPQQRPDANGSPAYTRRGYDLIRRLKLNDVEARFAGAINGTDSVLVLAQSIGIALNDALLIVFRFQSLEIVDFWGAGVLSLPGAAS